MKKVQISKYGCIKLNSYRPLCKNEIGLNAIKKFNYPPFIDSSCRREPDFENPNPSITALCRQGRFAPHLKKDDIIIYMTVGGRSKLYKNGHHLVAILQVEEVYETHQLGFLGYEKQGFPIPSNCMVPENYPLDFDKTAGNFQNKNQVKQFLSKPIDLRLEIGERRLKLWDKEYQGKSVKWKNFVRTKPIYLNTRNPAQIFKSDFEHIFGKIPNTQTPNNLDKEKLIKLGNLVNLNIII